VSKRSGRLRHGTVSGTSVAAGDRFNGADGVEVAQRLLLLVQPWVRGKHGDDNSAGD